MTSWIIYVGFLLLVAYTKASHDESGTKIGKPNLLILSLHFVSKGQRNTHRNTFTILGKGVLIEEGSKAGRSKILLRKKNVHEVQRRTADEQNITPLSEKNHQRPHKNKSQNVWKISDSEHFKRKENTNGSKNRKTIKSSQSMTNPSRKSKNNKRERFETFDALKRQESKGRLNTVQIYNES